MSYIYKITNTINDKIYVGKTHNSLEKRWKEHLRDSVRFFNRPLYSAMRKYGTDCFKIELIEECARDDAEQREKYWIKYYNSFGDGYNATLGGDGRTYIDSVVVMNLWFEGYSEKQIAQKLNICVDTVSSILYDNGLTPEEIRKRGFKTIEKEVVQIDPITNEILNVFPSIAEANRYLGKQHSGHIAAVCQGKRKTIYGFKWKYLKDMEQ